ncbi:hypothetical protein ColLi_05224 [Colletotrichum liriopes]|uniref:Uncharacterized protein n=1 Tax=Colletotrichum liriopes TaxID=708192 RepID=A0AA37GL77_9PEZI|nr:hypothetical protein ColLi_05224 [Colletotrichum liriopes]
MKRSMLLWAIGYLGYGQIGQLAEELFGSGLVDVDARPRLTIWTIKGFAIVRVMDSGAAVI